MKKEPRYFVIAVNLVLENGLSLPMNVNMETKNGRMFRFSDLYQPLKRVAVQTTQNISAQFSYSVSNIMEMDRDDFEEYTANENNKGEVAQA